MPTVTSASSGPPGVNQTINTVQPALVSRGTGCIMCHANIASNIITDFGYGGGGGINYFFGGIQGQSLPSGLTNVQGKSVYGDYDFTTDTSKGQNVNWGAAALASGTQVIVPHAPTAGLNMGAEAADTTLALYLQDILSRDTLAKGVTVKEISSLYIGAPTASRIISVSGVSSGGLRFTPASANSPAFSGIALNTAGTFYTNGTQPIICEGDLAIDGILWLNQPQIQTTMGCRLYVTKSVFVTGPISYSGSGTSQNLQITSAKMVALGLGHDTCNSTDPNPDSILQRLDYVNSTESQGRLVGFFTRTLGTPEQMLASLKDDADIIGTLSDASCGIGGRSVGFNHLFVNAPVVESRYQGQFNGLIVGELTLLSLGSLKFAFDPVFLNVPILPLIDSSDFLTLTQ